MKNGHSFGESLKCITFLFFAILKCIAFLAKKKKCIALHLDIMKLLTFELVNKESSVTLGPLGLKFFIEKMSKAWSKPSSLLSQISFCFSIGTFFYFFI